MRFHSFILRAFIAETKKLEADAQKKAQLEVVSQSLSIIKDLEAMKELAPEENEKFVILLREKITSIVGVDKVSDNLLEPGTPERTVLDKRVMPLAMEVIDPEEKEYQISIDKKPIE